ncbi:MAG TPA: hypothetical protein PK514_08260 [Spirochaetota bacterium]|nr:hypothetical protein [Spirochaetota bacterium]
MSTTKQKILDRRHELLEKKRLARIISEWVGKNKKVFWRYEVSCFYETYRITIINLPEPSEKDITVLPGIKLLKNQQKLQLCTAIKKACAKTEELCDPCIEVKVNYINGGAINAEVIQLKE